MKQFITSIAATKFTAIVIISLFSVLSVSANTNVINPINGIYQSVSVKTTEKSIILSWSSAADLNNSHFEVERSADKLNFKTVAVILDGFENETAAKTYMFKESISVLKDAQTAYYRLKLINNDGTASYSDLIVAQQ
jgi:hypothetical protein